MTTVKEELLKNIIKLIETFQNIPEDLIKKKKKKKENGEVRNRMFFDIQ